MANQIRSYVSPDSPVVSHPARSSCEALPNVSCSLPTFISRYSLSCPAISYCKDLLAMLLIHREDSHPRVFVFAPFFAWSTVSAKSPVPHYVSSSDVQFKYDLLRRSALTTLYKTTASGDTHIFSFFTFPSFVSKSLFTYRFTKHLFMSLFFCPHSKI